MDTNMVLNLVKARRGISSSARDAYIEPIIESVINELRDEKGINIDGLNPTHLMFVVDYSSWRYQSHGEAGGMPRHLQYRLHNLMIHNGGDTVG